MVTLLVVSCNQLTNHQHNSGEVSIELDNGKKWKVNTEMTPFITSGEQILNEFDGKDYKALAKQLKEKNNGLIKSCTMNGKSHDELHKWLHPHLQLVDALSKAKNEQEAEEVISELKKSFTTYNTYFQ